MIVNSPVISSPGRPAASALFTENFSFGFSLSNCPSDIRQIFFRNVKHLFFLCQR